NKIKNEGWYYLGKKQFECPGLDKPSVEFYIQNNSLPRLCNECYKALIFWEGNYSEENIHNLLVMLDSFDFDYRGKIDQGVAVFYFRSKEEMLEFLNLLENKMSSFNVIGKLQWRRACKEFQNLKPNLWRNAKTFIPEN
ncbi:MAG: hypothetical protein NTY03_16270, partial [Candidatus Bathyarchaeota archaeon]|nr:hypothetical protein [Candidatus Bathyarchaeota archaeon]